MKANDGVFAELEIAGTEFCDFLGPRPGVVKEQNQSVVPLREATGPWQVLQQSLHLVTFKEMSFSRWRPFHGDGGNPLACFEHRRFPAGNVFKQAVQCCQALVTRAHTVVTVILQVAKESDDVPKAQVFQRKLGDSGSLLLSDETQQKPDGVAVAAHRAGSQPFDGDEVIDEEGLDQ
nr:hypothetical protein [Arthrobacter terrae]